MMPKRGEYKCDHNLRYRADLLSGVYAAYFLIRLFTCMTPHGGYRLPCGAWKTAHRAIG